MADPRLDDEADAGEADVQVAFMPSGRRGHFAKGTTLLDAARALGVYVESACGGRAICGRCQVELAEGTFAKLNIESASENVSGFSEVETEFRQEHGLKDGRRLGCQTRILGDIVVDVPADSQMHRQIVRKRADQRRLPLDASVRLYEIDVEEPDMHKPSGDLERVCTSLSETHKVSVSRSAQSVLRDLQKVLRKGAWKVTVAIHDDGDDPAEIIAIWPGSRVRLLGLAVDLGSTTIACHLVDLNRGRVLSSAGLMNPQIRFGEDLMSRVSYIMMNPGSEVDITATVREALNTLAAKVAHDVGADVQDIFEIVVVGNPVMHHFLLGIDPTELGGAPFALASGAAQSMKASEIDIALNQEARLYTLPLIAGHVGADTAAVVLAEKPYHAEESILIVDIGTNAEIVLGDKSRLLACSSPTGPAFEGAELSSGQRAAPGAIERVRIDPETLEPRYKIIGSDLWSDEPGFEDEAAITGVIGICGSGVVEAIAEMFLAGIIDRDGAFRADAATRCPRIRTMGRVHAYVLREGTPDITITQNDVRAIQLAKAALQAGARLLMNKLGIAKVERIKLAGAFGSHIDTTYALILGLIPDCLPEHVLTIGNAAGTGAHMALQDRSARREIERVVRDIEKIETAVEPQFQNEFVAAMAIPHRDDPYDGLKTVVTLPEMATTGEQGSRRRRRRRERPPRDSGETVAASPEDGGTES
ncbi:MAG: ASKHA domain-containing protein [Hyphomicrobiaceae bacterium]